MAADEIHRLIIDTEDRDEEALKLGIDWLRAEALAEPPGVIAVPALRTITSLLPVITPGEAEDLGYRKEVVSNGARLLLMTKLVQPDSQRIGPVLAIWVGDVMLDRIEELGPSAICVVPWQRDQIQHWRDAWSPADL